MSKKVWLAVVGCVVGSAITALTAYSMSLERVHDHTITITTTRVRNYFDYRNSLLSPCVRADVSVQSEGSDDVSKYEDLLFRGFNCIGCHKVSELKTGPGQEVAINVVHAEGASLAEQEAAANAIVRVLLDAYANESMVSVVFVPNDSLTNICNAMHRAQFDVGQEASPDEPVYAQLQLQLRTPSGNSQTVYYTGGR